MAVFRELVIEWEGKKYDFTPSNKFLRRVDREVSLAGLSIRAERGEAPIFDMAFVVSEILREAGADMSEDDVIEEITKADNEERAQYLVGLINNIMPGSASVDAPSGGADASVKKSHARNRLG